MKKTFFAIMLAGSVAFAQKTTVISDRNVTIPVEISAQTVKFSRAGYTQPLVKILIPGIADVTILNHRNLGEGAPCLATYEDLQPGDVVQDRPATENVSFNIQLIKETTLDEKNSCRVVLSENIEGVIRGIKFVHNRSTEVHSRTAADCR